MARTKWLAVAMTLVAGAAGACKGKPTPAPNASGGETPAKSAASSSNLTDLTTSLDAVRSTFNAHMQEARFLTLLSPA
jgi:hypothetical protein